ncbi:MAG TPA: cyclohexanone monooxygenase [Gammaproteobacteria bacterium]|nr:cyclohexanone monooxygenase [Gammaproteobacteria bacterium]HAT28870.1 cyclohexanone monooxygenase [Gammaproteobacteria bacterium]
MSPIQKFDVVVVGAGFAGMYALHYLRKLGFAVRVLEIAKDVGGTWYWNRYPGARCDVASLEYSYQFSEELQQQWHWSEKYAVQAEILEYANHVADRFDLRRDIQFNTHVSAMHFSAANPSASNQGGSGVGWRITTDNGEIFQAQFCIMATGCLSSNNIPDFPGLDDYQGLLLHTGQWPHQEVDFAAKRVGMIGTGSSAIQIAPLIAAEADSLMIFQRTASYSIPAHNASMDADHERTIKADYARFREQNSQRYAALNNNPNSVPALEVSAAERESNYQQRWEAGGLPFLASFSDLATSLEANKTAAEFVRNKIRGIVKDPIVAELLCPQTVMGCKRLCVDSDYYQTFNRDNVSLIDVNACPIERITSAGIKTANQEYEFDVLIMATGFDAMTGALLRIDIRGRDGLSLRKKWRDGPKNYLGLTVNRFPNFFTITGPGSPSVLANMIVAIEQHVEWIGDCLQHLRANSVSTIEASSKAEDHWVRLVNKIANKTLFPSGCNSWYTGANIPGKPRIFMPYLGYPSYVEKCEQVASTGYRGFELGSL